MSLQQVVQSLASSLAQSEWTHFDTKLILQQRLPNKLQYLAPSLARQLVIHLPQPYAPPAVKIAKVLADLPEMELVARYVRSLKLQAPLPLTPQKFIPIGGFQSLQLPGLSCCNELAEWLAISPNQLVRFADLRGLSNQTNNAFAPHYRFRAVPKRNGSHRLIEEPKPILKRLQRRILHDLLNHVPSSPHSYGFVPERNCIQAAARHACEPVIVSFDLKDYFTSITYPRIFGLFRCVGYPPDVSRHLTGLVTLITPQHVLTPLGKTVCQDLKRRHLPQGAPTSPAIANLCSYNLDRRLAGLARRMDATYTRYADDLTFSGGTHIAQILRQAVPEIVKDESFTTNQSKTRVIPAHQRQVVTGIVVNQHVNIPRKDFDRLKAQIHRLRNMEEPDLKNRELLRQLDGKIAWVEQVNPRRGLKLRDQFEQVLSLS